MLDSMFFSNYRTSVLNDFSPVKKAIFQIYKDIGDEGSDADKASIFGKEKLNRKFKYVEQFPVQINPNELQLDYCSRSQRDLKNQPIDTKNCKGVRLIGPENNGQAGSVTITLKYNIYDEYKARTVDGAVPGNEISLHSNGKQITSLEKLREYAGNHNGYYTMFIWGEIHIFGFMDDLDITYESFSRWGEPLSATARATINRQPLEYYKGEVGWKKDGIEKDPFECVHTLAEGISKAKSYTKVEDIAMRAELLASNALR